MVSCARVQFPTGMSVQIHLTRGLSFMSDSLLGSALQKCTRCLGFCDWLMGLVFESSFLKRNVMLNNDVGGQWPSESEKRLIGTVSKAVANNSGVRGSIPSADVGKEPDREIFSPLSDASVCIHMKRELHVKSR